MSTVAPALADCPIAMTAVGAQLLDHEDMALSASTREKLWEIFVEIGRTWGNVPQESAGLRSSWLEFIDCKTTRPPSYIGEYVNAVAVMQELVEVLGRATAYQLLFFASGVAPGPSLTKLAHLKTFVVDEFIKVQITASGFRGFASSIHSPNRSLNYAGFIRGSRYNERPAARLYKAGAAARAGED